MVAAVDLIEALGRGWNRSQLPTASQLSQKPSAADYKQEQGENNLQELGGFVLLARMRSIVSLLSPGGSLSALYGLAIVSVAIALGIALLLGGYAFSLLLSAAAVAVWYRGAGPGFLVEF
jgi:hypothetical protein